MTAPKSVVHWTRHCAPTFFNVRVAPQGDLVAIVRRQICVYGSGEVEYIGR